MCRRESVRAPGVEVRQGPRPHVRARRARASVVAKRRERGDFARRQGAVLSRLAVATLRLVHAEHRTGAANACSVAMDVGHLLAAEPAAHRGSVPPESRSASYWAHIGLSLVEGLVRLHGGEVGVESVLGRGTTFTVRLLRGSTHLPNERVERTPRRARQSSFPTGSPRGARGVAPLLNEKLRHP